MIAACLRTERLLLRRWLDADCESFARMNSDPRVMEFMPSCLDRKESDLLVDRIERHFLAHGFGLYAVELREGQCFVGFVGLSIPAFEAAFLPAVEVGWRVAYEHWGEGLATEGASAVIRHAFEALQMEQLVSFTTPLNSRSIQVMKKVGMIHDPSGDFEHPNLPDGHWLRPHVLYRLSRAQWIEHRPGTS